MPRRPKEPSLTGIRERNYRLNFCLILYITGCQLLNPCNYNQNHLLSTRTSSPLIGKHSESTPYIHSHKKSVPCIIAFVTRLVNNTQRVTSFRNHSLNYTCTTLYIYVSIQYCRYSIFIFKDINPVNRNQTRPQGPLKNHLTRIYTNSITNLRNNTLHATKN